MAFEKGMMETFTKEKLIAAGTEKLAHILLSLYENQKDLRKQLDIIFVSLEENPKKLISLINKEIASLKRSSRFIEYNETSNFSNRLNQLRLHIVHDLALHSSSQAFELMLSFLDLHEMTLNRVDDNNGEVGEVFRQACQDLGTLCEAASLPLEDIVDLIFERFMKNGYGIYDEIIPNFKKALGEQGLEVLRQALQNSLSAGNTFKTLIGLKQLADCQKDVDAYIRACSLKDEPGDYERLEIAERLIHHWRSKEALTWLEPIQLPPAHGWHTKRRSLKIQALELEGEYERAQEERIAWFEDSLSDEIYGQILKNAKLDFKEGFRKKAIDRAFISSEPHAGLNFLIKIQEFEKACQFVHILKDKLQGQNYHILRPAADLLKEIDPLAATLLYRKLLEAVLQEAKSKYYNYAAKDFVMCGLLNLKITDWQNYKDHQSYLNDLLIKHKRKVSFWAEYKSALQKQREKAAKLLAKKNQEG